MLIEELALSDTSKIRIRVLIVDDESTIVEEIVEALNLQGFDVRGFSNPADAIDILTSDPLITVVMTDLDMPGLNGLELSQRVLGARTDENALEIVLLTGHADLEVAITAMRIGVFDLLRKPPRIKVLKETLEGAHRKAVMRRERHRTKMASHDSAVAEPASAAAGSGSFLSVISHELRTPLNPIIGFSQLIEQQSRTLEHAELQEYARHIREAGESLFALTESVLKVTEYREHPPMPTPEWIEPGELLARLRKGHLSAACVRDQRIDIDQVEDRLVRADGELLLQALSCLVANAIKFSPRGSAIVLSASIAGREISFQVSDSGPGMPQGAIERALQPFEQLDLRHSRDFGGLGIGLTIASLLADSLRGRLSIDSRVEGGTNAAILLPLTKPNSYGG